MCAWPSQSVRDATCSVYGKQEHELGMLLELPVLSRTIILQRLSFITLKFYKFPIQRQKQLTNSS